MVKCCCTSPFPDDILGEHCLGFHVNSHGVEHHGCRLELSHFEEDGADLGKLWKSFVLGAGHLRVKWIHLELVGALEGLGVDLERDCLVTFLLWMASLNHPTFRLEV